MQESNPPYSLQGPLAGSTDEAEVLDPLLDASEIKIGLLLNEWGNRCQRDKKGLNSEYQNL